MKPLDQFTTKARPIHSVQWLRGIAAIAVVFLHASTTMGKYNVSPSWFRDWDWGRSGVDLFFVISGFIMVHTTRSLDHGISGTLQFWGRRLIRIAPPYWILTTVAVAISVFLPSLTDYRPSLDHVVASYLFIPWVDLRGTLQPPVRVGWTLNFEAYFYFIFGLALLLPRRWLPGTLLIWATGSVLLGVLLMPLGPIPSLMTSPLLLEFVAGAMIASLRLQGWTLPIWTAIACAVLGFSAIYLLDCVAPEWPEAIKFGVPSILILAGALGIEIRLPLPEHSFLESIGNWSYALYLTHVLSLACFGKIIMALKLYEYMPNVLLLLLDLSFVIGVGAAMSLLIEQPLHRWMLARMADWRNIGWRPAPDPDALPRSRTSSPVL